MQELSRYDLPNFIIQKFLVIDVLEKSTSIFSKLIGSNLLVKDLEKFIKNGLHGLAKHDHLDIQQRLKLYQILLTYENDTTIIQSECYKHLAELLHSNIINHAKTLANKNLLNIDTLWFLSKDFYLADAKIEVLLFLYEKELANHNLLKLIDSIPNIFENKGNNNDALTIAKLAVELQKNNLIHVFKKIDFKTTSAKTLIDLTTSITENQLPITLKKLFSLNNKEKLIFNDHQFNDLSIAIQLLVNNKNNNHIIFLWKNGCCFEACAKLIILISTLNIGELKKFPKTSANYLQILLEKNKTNLPLLKQIIALFNTIEDDKQRRHFVESLIWMKNDVISLENIQPLTPSMNFKELLNLILMAGQHFNKNAVRHLSLNALISGFIYLTQKNITISKELMDCLVASTEYDHSNILLKICGSKPSKEKIKNIIKLLNTIDHPFAFYLLAVIYTFENSTIDLQQAQFNLNKIEFGGYSDSHFWREITLLASSQKNKLKFDLSQLNISSNKFINWQQQETYNLFQQSDKNINNNNAI